MKIEGYVHLFFTLFILPVEALGGMPTFIGQLQNVTVSEGRDATFTCSVTNLGGHKVAWIKSDTKAILAIHYHVITNNDNLQVTHNDKDTWTLVIKNVRQKDGGEYMCQVNSVPMVSQVATLEVVIPPQISDKHSTEDLSVAEGGSAKFICSATGHPHPTIIWQKMPKSQKDRAKIRFHDKKGKEVHQKRVHGEVLELQKVSREDMGTYLCIAKNNVPPAVSKNFKLTVNFDPQIEVRNQVVGAPVGTEIILRCSIQASPKPMTFWMRKEGAMIVPSMKYNISEVSLNDYHFVSTLHIKSLNKNDFAQYVCVAKNTIGKSEEMIKIYEIEREIRTTEEVTTLKTYKYEEYYTQPSYQGDADDKTIKIDQNASNQNGRKRKDYPSKPEKNNYLDTSTSFKYGYETGGGYRSAAATPPSTESHHYKSYFLVTITMIIQSLIFATYH